MALKKKIKQIAGAFIHGAEDVAGNIGRGIATIASLPGRYLDRVEAGLKKVDAAKREDNRKLIEQNFGSVEAYNKLQMDELEKRRKKNSKSKLQSSDYQTEYAKRMGGTATRF